MLIANRINLKGENHVSYRRHSCSSLVHEQIISFLLKRLSFLFLIQDRRFRVKLIKYTLQHHQSLFEV